MKHYFENITKIAETFHKCLWNKVARSLYLIFVLHAAASFQLFKLWKKFSRTKKIMFFKFNAFSLEFFPHLDGIYFLTVGIKWRGAYIIDYNYSWPLLENWTSFYRTLVIIQMYWIWNFRAKNTSKGSSRHMS